MTYPQQRGQPELGVTVKAQVGDLSQDSGKRQVRGRVVAHLATQFLIERTSGDRTVVRNDDSWVED